MKKVNIKGLAIAFGFTGLILYVSCALFMAIAGKNVSIKFFNSLLHGFDTAPVIRMNIPWWESIIGMVETFVLGGLIGMCVAAIYNATTKKNK